MKCSLTTFDFTHVGEGNGPDLLKYCTISYAWGDPTPVSKIWIGSGLLWVPHNTHFALWQARRARPRAFIWIDAICIGQSNAEEKALQVKMMGEIFHRASTTLISLGPHENGSELLFYFYSPVRPWEANLHPLHLPHRVSDLWPDCDPTRFVRAFRAFRLRSYWRRTWIIQEIWLSRRLLIMCGQDCLSYGKLRRYQSCSEIIQSSRIQIKDMKDYRNGRCSDVEHSRIHSTIESSSNKGIEEVMSNRGTLWSQQERQQPVSMPLIWFIDLFQGFQSTDIRDRFYSVLGMVKLPQGVTFTPDYSISCFELAGRILELGLLDTLSGGGLLFSDVEALLAALHLGINDIDIQNLIEERRGRGGKNQPMRQ